ncbi:MAG TPA: ImmA/IrrE family metallo-endopeptidase [Thermoguttaceae bacterium]|nr:ImmA/IrrE family metallo-endopeptidase [Thermoguttaceae bacterium]
MLAEIVPEELAAGLDAVAWQVLAEAGVEGPPVDAFEVARALGIAVALDDRQRGRARYVRLAGRGRRRPRATILLRPDPRAERRQWAVAHEIGEHAARRVFAHLGVDPREAGPNARETAANHLAGRLLLPTEWFAADAVDCGWDLVELKSRYATASHELIARRMLECGPPVIISIFDHQELYFRRSNLPGRVPPPSSVEIQCWRAVHAANRPQQAYEGPRTIQGWPVHEEGWKREILRTEVEDIVVEYYCAGLQEVDV